MFGTLFVPNNLPTEPEVLARGEILKLINANKTVFPENLRHVVDFFCDFHNSEMDAWCVHDKLQRLSSDGDYLGFHLEAQNCVLLVERISSEEAVVSVWEVQASNHAVMSNVQSAMQNLPRKSLKVSFSVLENFACCEQIAGLITIEHPKAVPKSNKRGEVKETRDVNNPMYVGLFSCVENKIIELWNVNCTAEFASVEMSNALLVLLENYMDFGVTHLKDEKLVISRVLLISTCLTLLLDRIAVYNHSMVKQYFCGINMECFYKLLLKEKKFLDLLHAMEIYVNHRDVKASLDNTCFDPNINRQSFCVRFAQFDTDMCRKKETIQRRCTTNQERKKFETRNNMERYRTLMKESNSLSCTYVDGRRHNRSRGWYDVTVHSSSCHKCSLKNQATSVKMD